MHDRSTRRWHLAVVLPLGAALSFGGSLPPAGAVAAADAEAPRFALPADADLAADAALTTNDVPEPVTGEVDLGHVQRAALDVAATLAPEDWDLDALAWSLEGDPDAAFAFVRDRIGYQDYPGVLRGAAGTLAARAGNAADRALLLKDLLERMRVPARFAFGELDPAAGSAVRARVGQPPVDPLPEAGAAATAGLDAEAIATRARRDYALLRAALGDRVTAAAPATATDEPRPHVWVQVLSGTDWLDLDPTLADAQPGVTLATAGSTADEIPPEERQTVQLQLVAETLTGGVLDSRPVLDTTLDAADSATSEIFLYFQPEIGGLGGSIAQALGSAAAYVPELMVDGDVTQGSSFPVSGANDIFGGDDVLGPAEEDALVSLRLVVTRAAPGEPSESFVRTFLDRAPAADRAVGTIDAQDLAPLDADEAGPVELQWLHHIMVSTGGIDPRSQAIERAQLARFVGTHLLDPEQAGEYALSDLLWPVAVADRGLVLASERAIVPDVSEPGLAAAVITRPRIFLASLTSTGRDGGISFATDLLADDVRIVGPGGEVPADAAVRQLWYGAAEAALETQFVLGVVRGLDPSTRSIDAVSLHMDEPLTVLDPGEPAIAAGSRPALRSALGEGLLAVVPGDVDRAGAWWTVDPDDGATRSILDPGLGAGTGAGNNYVNASQGVKPYYVDDQGNSWVRKTPGPPSRCGSGQEYVAIIGCVSIPAAWAIRGLGVVLVLVVGYYVNSLWKEAIGQ